MSTPKGPTEDPGETLSAHLRAATALLHARVEQLLGLPDAIRDRDDYRRLLERFFGLYERIEQIFATFDDWTTFGLAPAARSHVPALLRDLAALGVNPERIPRVPPDSLTHLPTFPHALGALYVLEGSTLGGRIILRALETRLGKQIAGATCFLSGYGADTGPMWQSFRSTPDSFDAARPGLRSDVLAGAEQGFHAILTWFLPAATPEGRPA